MTVYSKERGFTHPPRLENRSSYPLHRAPRVSVPPNYRGHAIVDGEERPLGSLFAPETDAPSGSDLPSDEQPVPRFDDLPRVSQLGDSHRRLAPSYLPADAYTEVTDSPVEADLPESGTAPHRPPQNTTAAHKTPQNATSPHDAPPISPHFHKSPPISSRPHESPLPAISLPRHPLGTLSVGLEELLLLGLILFLLRENGDTPDRGDLDETVILLGLLLLLG